MVSAQYGDVLAHGKLVEREHLAVAGRDVSVANSAAATPMCVVTIDVEPGALQINVPYLPQLAGTHPDEVTTIDQACTEARKILDIITPVLPDRLD